MDRADMLRPLRDEESHGILVARYACRATWLPGNMAAGQANASETSLREVCIRASKATGLPVSKEFRNRERDSSRAQSRRDGSNPRPWRLTHDNRERPCNTAIVANCFAHGG
jgi:hypothetical protein